MTNFKNRVRITENAASFILAGNSSFTLFSKKTGKHLVYKVQKIKAKNKRSKDEPDIWFVKVMTGHDNESDFEFIGTLRLNGERISYTHSRKSRIDEEDTKILGLKWFLHHVSELPDNMIMYHNGSCAKCGRKLVVPASIESGYGPSCYKMIFGKALENYKPTDEDIELTDMLDLSDAG